MAAKSNQCYNTCTYITSDGHYHYRTSLQYMDKSADERYRYGILQHIDTTANGRYPYRTLEHMDTTARGRYCYRTLQHPTLPRQTSIFCQFRDISKSRFFDGDLTN